MIRPVLCLLLVVLSWGVEISGATETKLAGLRLVSQCPAEVNRELARELVRTRDALAAWIGRNVRPLPEGLPALPVLLFADRASFQAYAGTHARHVATAHAEGYYSGDGTPGGGQLVLFRDGGRELSTARHELVHYLLDQVLPARAGSPVWFNEGLAVCVEDAWIDPGSVRISAVPRQRQKLLRQLAAAGGAPLSRITALGADGWLKAAGADRGEADRQYTASYGAVLFLLNLQPDLYWGFLRRMAAGEAHDAAYAATVGRVPGGLDNAWRTWAAKDVWQAARGADGSDSAAKAFEHGLSWLSEHLPPGDPAQAARWLAGAARGFAGTPGYEFDAAIAWLAVSEALGDLDAAVAGEAAETAAELYASRGHTAGQAEALLQACRAWGADNGTDWNRAAALGRVAVQLAEAVGPDELRAAAYAAYGASLVPGRATAAPDGGDQRAEAFAALQRARAIHHAAGDTAREAAVVLLSAQAITPPDDSVAGWQAAIDLATEAITLWRTLPEADEQREDLARAHSVLAGLYRPDRNPGGDWQVASGLYEREAQFLDLADDRRRLRNRIDRGTCLLGLEQHAQAAQIFGEAERLAVATRDDGLAAFAAYQVGWAMQRSDPLAAAEAFIRAAPRYRLAGKLREEAMAFNQAAQASAAGKAPATTIADLFRKTAELEEQRGDEARAAYARYQQAWHSEPGRQQDADPVVAGELYAAAARLWKTSDIVRSTQALQQRARILTPVKGAAAGWSESTRDWAAVAEALGELPENAERLAERGHALHQQAWTMIRGDGSRLTPQARRLFTEAVRLQRAGGNEAGAKASSSWIRD